MLSRASACHSLQRTSKMNPGGETGVAGVCGAKIEQGYPPDQNGTLELKGLGLIRVSDKHQE